MPTSFIIVNIIIGLLWGVSLAFGGVQMVIAFMRFTEMLHVRLFSKGFFTTLRGRMKRFRPIWVLQAVAMAAVSLVGGSIGGSLFRYELVAGFDAPALARVGIGAMGLAMLATMSYIMNSPGQAQKLDIGEWGRAKSRK